MTNFDDLPEPIYCRPEAFRSFVEQLPTLWTTEGLLRGATAVSMHALDDVSPQAIEQQLAEWARRVRDLADGGPPSEVLAALRQVLFVEENFGGETYKYYHALNSYVPAVMKSRRGLPILLSLLFKVVGEWAGLSIAGVNAPGHFMVRVRTESGWQIVDPFYGGELLTRDDVFERLDRIAQRMLPRSDDLLAAPTHMQWLYRIIGNLRQLFLTEGRNDDLGAMNELLFALRQSQMNLAG
ncbi:MAG: transglutaminase-like domain-containing protein [Pirellulaceae bacterium]|nr:transglutaminase-like domain-containing protein [Pirellulaceae bacterium]